MNKNLFNSIQLPFQKSNVFDLTHDVKMSTRMGRLTPILVQECVPGDKFNISCESLIRFAPLVAPVMHRMSVTMHYFFVPHRITWPGWEDFITNNSAPAFPYVTLDTSDDEASLANYLGLPLRTGTPIEVSALPFAAYQAIYNEYYRDQNLMPEIDYKLVNGVNPGLVFKTMRNRAWGHDYFTSALPFAQKGGAVSIPLGDVNLKDPWGPNPDEPVDKWPKFRNQAGNMPGGALEQDPGDGGLIEAASQADTPLAYDPNGTLEVGSTTINDLRRSFRLQEWLERNARGGTRYIENILAHFGVRSSDKRMQRPEYITGTKSPVVISEVLNTTGEQGGLPQGNQAGHGVSVTSGKYGRYFCEEHGYIIGIMSVLPETAYQQGIPRHFSKFNYLDYYWPSFAHIGEQEILNKEIYNDAANPTGIFGYTPRYAEYKYQPSRVAGQFQTSLDFWHLGRIFGNEPALNSQFIEMTAAEADRIFAVQSGDDNLFCHVLNKVKAVRKMPKFGTPAF